MGEFGLGEFGFEDSEEVDEFGFDAGGAVGVGWVGGGLAGVHGEVAPWWWCVRVRAVGSAGVGGVCPLERSEGGESCQGVEDSLRKSAFSIWIDRRIENLPKRKLLDWALVEILMRGSSGKKHARQTKRGRAIEIW